MTNQYIYRKQKVKVQDLVKSKNLKDQQKNTKEDYLKEKVGDLKGLYR